LRKASLIFIESNFLINKSECMFSSDLLALSFSFNDLLKTIIFSSVSSSSL